MNRIIIPFITLLVFSLMLRCKSDATSSCSVTSYKFGDVTHLYKYEGSRLIGYHLYVDGAKGEPGVIEYRYDDKGRVTTEVVKQGNFIYANSLEYDVEGRLIRLIAPGGDTTRYTYNAFGQLATEENTDGFKTTHVYSDNVTHNPSSTILTYRGNPDGTLSYAYDSKPNPFRNMVPYGSTKPDNNVISITKDAVVLKTFTYEYGNLGYWTTKTVLPVDETESRAYSCQ